MKAAGLLLSLSLGAAGAAAASDPLAGLAWLAGCWSAERAEAGSIEQWTAPAGGLMLGLSRTLRGARVVEFEFMQIRALADGRVLFIAQPGGQAPTSFTLQPAAADGGAVFENPAHDFPQRVIYRRGSDGSLAARIEGLRDGVLRAIDFPMRRQACASGDSAAPASPGMR